MNTTTDNALPEVTSVTAEDLRWAAAAAQQLTNRDIQILSAHWNGRRMVLQIERDPNLENMQIGMVRRQPAPGGCDRIFAGNHLGVQLQWSVFEPAARVLEVVSG